MEIYHRCREDLLLEGRTSKIFTEKSTIFKIFTIRGCVRTNRIKDNIKAC